MQARYFETKLVRCIRKQIERKCPGGFNLQSLISFSVNIGISFDTTRRAYDVISHGDSFIENLLSYNKSQINWGV